jgi:hypothetical protein
MPQRIPKDCDAQASACEAAGAEDGSALTTVVATKFGIRARAGHDLQWAGQDSRLNRSKKRIPLAQENSGCCRGAGDEWAEQLSLN